MFRIGLSLATCRQQIKFSEYPRARGLLYAMKARLLLPARILEWKTPKPGDKNEWIKIADRARYALQLTPSCIAELPRPSRLEDIFVCAQHASNSITNHIHARAAFVYHLRLRL